MTESALQMPHLTQTGRGGKSTAKRPRKMSAEHMMAVVIESNFLRRPEMDEGSRSRKRARIVVRKIERVELLEI